jgi:hypothetical protein
MSDMNHLHEQTMKNTGDIASLVSTVGQLAQTVERHEKMMVAGFDKLEAALATGMGTVQSQITSHISSIRPPWWQLFMTVATGVSVFGGGLLALIIFLNNVQDSQIARLQAESERIAVAVAEASARDRAQDVVNNYREKQLERVDRRQEEIDRRAWETSQIVVQQGR